MKFHSLLGLVVMCALPVTAGAETPLAITVHPDLHRAIDNSAQKQEEVRRTAGNAVFANKKQWELQRASTIEDMTDYLPGFFAQPYNGAESSKISIRGSGLANRFQGRGIAVLQDGIPINMADGEFEFPVIDPWLIEYIQVFPGANALEYGASTLGGAVNFITPAERNGGEIKFEGGSFGTAHGLASTAGNWTSGSLFAAGSAFHQDGFRSNNRQDNLRFNANAGWRSGDLHQKIYLNHTNSWAEIPGTLTGRQIGNHPDQANVNNVRGRYRRDLDITRLAHKTAWQEGPQRLETTLFYIYRDLDNPVTTYIFEHNNDYGGRIKYSRNIGRDNFITGLNLSYGTQDETRYENERGRAGDHILDRDLTAMTLEAYGQYEHLIAGNLYGIAGNQVTYATRDIKQQTPSQDEQKSDFAGFNPRIGLRYDLDAQTQIFTNVSGSFEPPTWAELSGGNDPGFQQLDAQKATTGEIGARHTALNISWSAAYYYSRLQDEFVNYEFASGDAETINVDESIHQGIELAAQGLAAKDVWLGGDGIEARASYTWSRFSLRNDPLYGDNRLPGAPEHFFRGEILYRHPSGLSFGPNVEWVPKGYAVDLANTLKTDPYSVVGARLAWEAPRGGWNVYLEGRNLFDRRYIAAANAIPNANGRDGNYFYPGEGRSFYMGASLKF